MIPRLQIQGRLLSPNKGYRSTESHRDISDRAMQNMSKKQVSALRNQDDVWEFWIVPLCLHSSRLIIRGKAEIRA